MACLLCPHPPLRKGGAHDLSSPLPQPTSPVTFPPFIPHKKGFSFEPISTWVSPSSHFLMSSTTSLICHYLPSVPISLCHLLSITENRGTCSSPSWVTQRPRGISPCPSDPPFLHLLVSMLYSLPSRELSWHETPVTLNRPL